MPKFSSSPAPDAATDDGVDFEAPSETVSPKPKRKVTAKSRCVKNDAPGDDLARDSGVNDRNWHKKSALPAFYCMFVDLRLNAVKYAARDTGFGDFAPLVHSSGYLR